MEHIMKWQKSFLIAFVCLVFGFTATILVAQQAQDDFSAGEVGAGANLVVTSVAGPTTAILNQTISLTYTPVFDCRSGDYWSGGTFADPYCDWGVSFYDGSVRNNLYESGCVLLVRCVRSGP
jgi:hypothetical protein